MSNTTAAADDRLELLGQIASTAHEMLTQATHCTSDDLAELDTGELDDALRRLEILLAKIAMLT